MRPMAAGHAAHGIRVNVIAAGMVRTPAAAASEAGLLEYEQKKQPLRRDMLDAQEVARAALFLLGPDAPPITRQILAVDAGWSITTA